MADYLNILIDEEVNHFVLKNYGECFKSTRERLRSKLDEEKNLRKVPELLYIFLATHDEIEKYVELIEKMPEAKILMQSNSSDGSVRHYNIEILNLFALELQLSNTKLVLKKKN